MTIVAAALPVAQTAYVARGGPVGHLWLAMPGDTIGSRLRYYRRSKHWSQRRLAEESGVTRQTIAEMERGAVTIPREPANIQALAAALGIKMRQLAEPTGWYADEPSDGTSLEDVLAALHADGRVSAEGKASLDRQIRLEVEATERQADAERKESTPHRQDRPRRRAV